MHEIYKAPTPWLQAQFLFKTSMLSVVCVLICVIPVAEPKLKTGNSEINSGRLCRGEGVSPQNAEKN